MGLAFVVLAAGGCGGSSSGSSSGSASASASGSSAKHAHAHAPIREYHLKLTGAAETPPGAPGAAGGAAIALHGTTKVCWRFAHLAGFTGATFAHIHQGAKGTSGNIVVPLSTSPKLHHKGCVSASPAVISAIERDPGAYYVNIHSVKYPGGAVRAQL